MVIEKGLTHCGFNKKTGRPEYIASADSPCLVCDMLGESPTSKLWSLMWEWRDRFEGTISEIAECACISRTSLYKIFPFFLENEWWIPSKYNKGIQRYKVNKNHFVVKKQLDTISTFIRSYIEIQQAKEAAEEKLYKEFKKKDSRKPRNRRKAQRNEKASQKNKDNPKSRTKRKIS